MAAPMTTSPAGLPKNMKNSKKRKNKSDDIGNENKGDTSKKKRHENAFTDIDFKVMFRDTNTTFAALEKFIEQAKKYPSESHYDIVGNYCRGSGECNEVLQLLETGKRKAGEANCIFEMIEMVLLRISDDLIKFKVVGQNIVRRILAGHLGLIYATLAMKNKSSHIKGALKLMTAMIMQGESSAKEFQTQFDFQHRNLKPLLNRRDRKDPQDVRTCLLHFIMSFFVVGSNLIIRQVVEVKGFLNSIFQGLSADKLSTLDMILPTIHEKIVQNPVINKTSKIRLFNDKTLTDLAALYDWKGPASWKSSDKNNKESEPMETYQSPEDNAAVRESVHKILLDICCDKKYGINFHDKSLSTSGKNMNHILTNFMNGIKKPYADELKSELIVGILKACPDQLHWYLSSLRESLTPRESPSASGNWNECMKFVIRIYEAQDFLRNLGDVDTLTPAKMTSMAISCLIPPKDVLPQIIASIKHKHMEIRHMGLEVIKIIIRNLNSVIAFCDEKNSRHENCAEFADLLRDAAKKILPSMNTIFSCWQSVTTKTADENMDTDEQPDVRETSGMPSVEEVDHLAVILAVLCGYQAAFPVQYFDKALDFSSLLGGVKRVCPASETRDELPLLQTYILKLLSGSDVRQINWNKKNSDGHSAMYLLIEMVVSNSRSTELALPSMILLRKLFACTGIFEGTSDEIDVWMRHLNRSDEKATSECVTFFEKAMLNLLNDPYSQTELISEAVSEATSSGVSQDLEVSSLATSDLLADSIVSMDDVDFEDGKSVTSVEQSQSIYNRKFPFSPLVSSALECAVQGSDIAIREYMTDVLLDILLTQVNPLPLCTLIQSKSSKVKLDEMAEKMALWTVKKTPKKKKLNSAGVKRISSMLHDAYLNGSETLLELLSSVRDHPIATKVELIKQLLLYIWTEVEHKKKSNDTDNVESLLKVIASILESVKESLDKSANEEPDESEKIYRLLQIQEPGIPDILVQLYTTVLQHPLLNKMFLYREKSKKYKRYRNVVTSYISKMVEIAPVQLRRNLASSISPYIVGVTTELREQTACESKIVEKALCGFVSNFELTTLIQTFELLFSNKFNEDQVGDLDNEDSYCQMLISVLKELCIRRDAGVFSGHQVSHAIVSKLFELSKDLPLKPFLLNILNECPSYCVCINKETFVSYLSLLNTDENSRDIISILLVSSKACLVWAGEWMLESKLLEKKKLRMAESSLNFVQCYLLSSNALQPEMTKNIKEGYWSLINGFLTGDTEFSDSESLARIAGLLLKCSKGAGNFDELFSSFEKSPVTLGTEWWKLFDQALQSAIISEEEVLKKKKAYLRRSIKGLISTFSTKGENNAEKDNFLITKVLEYCKAIDSAPFESSKQWSQFVKEGLKKHYTNPKYLKLLCHLLPKLYMSDEGLDISPQLALTTLYDMILSHSQFINLMIGYKEEDTEKKESLVELLLAIVSLDESCCKTQHIAVFLGAYTATLSSIDQKLLMLLWNYEKNGSKMCDYKPFIFGPKAIEYHAIHKNLGSSLLRHATTDQVLDLFDKEKLLASALNFPVRRQLTLENSALDEKQLKSELGSYDPNFVLPLFGQLLKSENVVPCRKFIENNCLGYTISALSAHDVALRGLAAHVISLYVGHLEGSRFGDKSLILYLLDLVKNSLEKPGTKLACVITVFLARAVQILLHPDNDMYSVISSFLLLKPNMDVMGVPEFYKLFNSSSLEFKKERSWILNLLSDGLRETLDYHICQKRYVFKMLLSFYNSALSDSHTQNQTLSVLSNACKIKSVAFDMCKNLGLLSWLNSVIYDDCHDLKKAGNVIAILCNLWESMLSGRDDQSEQEAKRPCLPPQFTNEFFQTLRLFLNKTRIMPEELMTKFSACLLSVLKHVHKTNTMMGAGQFKPIAGALQTTDAAALLWKVTRLTGEREIHGEAARLLETATGAGPGRNSDGEVVQSNFDSQSLISCLLGILPHLVLLETPDDTLEKFSLDCWVLVLKWIFTNISVEKKADCQVLITVMSWIRHCVRTNMSIKRTLLEDEQSSKSCVLDLLAIYDRLALLTRSHSSSRQDFLLEDVQEIKRLLNEVFLEILDVAIKPDILTTSSGLYNLLHSKELMANLSLASSMRKSGDTGDQTDVLSLMVREVWFSAQSMIHFTAVVKKK